VRRRRFIAALAGAAVSPLTAHAQQPERVRRVGVLLPWPEKDAVAQASTKAFSNALSAFGWVEDKNIRIDYRFGAGDPTLYKTYAAELVGLAPDVILADVLPAVAAVREQTRTIPIVFLFVPDPVGLGLVQSLARPGGTLALSPLNRTRRCARRNQRRARRSGAGTTGIDPLSSSQRTIRYRSTRPAHF
jgi:putative ABC transport system substrate-binding protein